VASQLQNMMAEMESWESATEFGIPEDLWASYQVRLRSDDLYIAVLSSLFDALRSTDATDRQQRLSALAKTLLLYSRSAAAKYLEGVDKTLNALYCSAVFYLADFPATATLLAAETDRPHDLLDEEAFLHGLLSRRLSNSGHLEGMLAEILNSSDNVEFEGLLSDLRLRIRDGLELDPRLFIAAKLAFECLTRFAKSNIWNCLRTYSANYSFELWGPFLSNSASFPLWELFPSQMTAIKSGILSDSDNVYSMQMPTSSGKTSLCEIIIYNEVKGRNKKVLFLVPFRALATEIREGISQRLESAGVTVVASHGGNIPTRTEGTAVDSADVLIITPEKFSALVQTLPELEDRFDTVICDEGHLIDDSNRGLQYELLLTKIKSSKSKNRKIIFISAILPNVDSIHRWLGGVDEMLSKSEYVPVETDYAFITPQDSTSWQLDFNTVYKRPRSYFLRSFLTNEDFKYRNPKTGNLNLVDGRKTYTTLACAAAIKSRKNGPVALFTTQKDIKNGVAGLAKKMLELYKLRVSIAEDDLDLSGDLPILAQYIAFQFGQDYSLSKLLEYGVGFHHGDLPQEIRREMEGAVRDQVIGILICTSTLAEGVNLPIRTLVIHTIRRFDGSRRSSIKRRSIKNIVGRVGRAGKETKGRIIFANNSERSDVEDVFRNSSMEPATGALFKLIDAINEAMSRVEIQLSNDIFEAQGNEFLSILDSVDIALINLIPPATLIEDIEQHVESTVERTLAYQYCDTEELRHRIVEVFILRARFLREEVPRDSWQLLKKSGSSPRYWKFVNSRALIERSEWQLLDSVDDSKWLEEVVLKIVEMPTLQIEEDLEVLKAGISGWMAGCTYGEIANACDCEVDEALKLLGHAIGFKLQDALSTLTQLAIARHGEDNMSEVARSWSSLLRYGLGDLQQLDLFERGVSDRLGVWGISRYLKEIGESERGMGLIVLLRSRSAEVLSFLDKDLRVPIISAKRTCEELGIA
jgi:ATP-dependent DNA helicase